MRLAPRATPPLAAATALALAACLAHAAGEGAGANPPPPPLVDSTLASRLLGRWAGRLEHGAETTDFALEFAPRGRDTIDARVWFPALNLYGGHLRPARGAGDHVELSGAGIALDLKGDSLVGAMFAGALPAALGRAGGDTRVFEAASTLPDSTSEHGRSLWPERAWTDSLGAPLWATPVVDRGVAYVGDAAGRLHALDVRDGAPRWTVDLHGALYGAVAIAGDLVCAVVDPGRLVCVDRASGAPRWQVAFGAAGPARSVPSLGQSDWDDLSAAPLVDRGVVYVGSADSVFRALDARDGRTLWRFHTDGSIRSTARADPARVYVASRDGRVYALDRATGREAWRFDTGSPVMRPPLVEAGRVYVGTRDRSTLTALDAATGKPLWSRFFWLSWVDSTPRLDGGVLFSGSSDNQRVHAFDPRTGRTRWETWVGGWTRSTPLVRGDEVWYATTGGDGYFIPSRGSIGALDRRTGAPRWRIPLPAARDRFPDGDAASLVSAGPLVLAAGLDGTLTAYRPSPAR